MKKILIALFFIGLISLVVAIPNPAPIYCENMGHVSNGVNCIFDDGESCELWDFYNGECGPDYVKELACVELGESLSPGKVCCEGLVGKTPARIGGDGICGTIVGSFGVCVACGDGDCDEAFENRCNCEVDCSANDKLCNTLADTDCDGNVCNLELLAYMVRWKNEHNNAGCDSNPKCVDSMSLLQGMVGWKGTHGAC